MLIGIELAKHYKLRVKNRAITLAILAYGFFLATPFLAMSKFTLIGKQVWQYCVLKTKVHNDTVKSTAFFSKH